LVYRNDWVLRRYYGEAAGFSMKQGFGRHFTADLYFCQNEIWKNPKQFYTEIFQFTHSCDISDDNWQFWPQGSGNILISGELNDLLVLIQVFPAQNYLALDIFSWELQANFHQFSEGLVELFAPQVVAAVTRLRAEHMN
jgi:S-adenosylmethionine/arginine decarboxylase-like enzyme